MHGQICIYAQMYIYIYYTSKNSMFVAEYEILLIANVQYDIPSYNLDYTGLYESCWQTVCLRSLVFTQGHITLGSYLITPSTMAALRR